MNYSKYYGMYLPEGTDRYNVEEFNANTEKIDENLYNLTAFERDGRDHIASTSNPHHVTKDQLGLSKVENKTSAEIRGEMTSANVTSALGFTPLMPATAAPGNVASASSVGTSTYGARQDHTHGISVTTGDSNGQIKVAGINATVKGLGDVAYISKNSSLNEFLRGDGTWASPSESAGGSAFYYQTTEPTNTSVNTVWIG